MALEQDKMRRAIGMQVDLFTEEDRRSRLEAIKSNLLKYKSEILEKHLGHRKASV
jgi:hypothetical protein